jgi:hypothetical protein
MPAKHSPTRRVPSRPGVTALENPALRQLALKALAKRAGAAPDAAALAAAAQRAYDDLTQVSAPLIGQVGVDAVTGRTLYLAQRKYPWLVHTREPEQWKGPFAQIVFCLERQDPAVATEAAGAVLTILTGLLVTFIGEPLTARLLRKAWPDAFSDASIEET